MIQEKDIEIANLHFTFNSAMQPIVIDAFLNDFEAPIEEGPNDKMGEDVRETVKALKKR